MHSNAMYSNAGVCLIKLKLQTINYALTSFELTRIKSARLNSTPSILPATIEMLLCCAMVTTDL